MKILQKFTIYDLIIISIMATIGIIIKPIVSSLAHIVSAPLLIPGGALAGGLYMMWLVLGFGITKKYGTATLIALVQALIVIFTGVLGTHGIMSLISYTLPGILMDIVLLLMRNRIDNVAGAFVGGIVANVAGTFSVNFIFFQLPWVYLLLTLLVAALSGGIGGLLAWQLIKILSKYKLVKNKYKIKDRSDDDRTAEFKKPEEK